eukprot:scaffold228083_cov32-Tisochrysis_lutea.AAC.1
MGGRAVSPAKTAVRGRGPDACGGSLCRGYMGVARRRGGQCAGAPANDRQDFVETIARCWTGVTGRLQNHSYLRRGEVEAEDSASSQACLIFDKLRLAVVGRASCAQLEPCFLMRRRSSPMSTSVALLAHVYF